MDQRQPEHASDRSTRFGRVWPIRPRSSWRGFTTTAVTLFTVILSACQGTLNGLDLGSNLVGGVTYRVTGLVVAESFPVQIGVSVEIVNESNQQHSVVFPDGCVVLLRAYDGGSDPVWDMSGTVACSLALIEVVLPPGATEMFESGLVSAATILGDRLPNGEYRISAYLRPGQVVELNAGTVDLAVP